MTKTLALSTVVALFGMTSVANADSWMDMACYLGLESGPHCPGYTQPEAPAAPAADWRDTCHLSDDHADSRCSTVPVWLR